MPRPPSRWGNPVPPDDGGLRAAWHCYDGEGKRFAPGSGNLEPDVPLPLPSPRREHLADDGPALCRTFLGRAAHRGGKT
jgi:hypothetical protein